eukprot:TRINITY_DN66208_c0_g1_i1.p1 TRINITY_DN66208_c0_g1~~TRINITY_DN66208_c0_g1_i1.p1  ORF type:complete len:420 (+),score=134.03 TRINITY_DN66208_c0_g1_i1:79-1260(+)
MLQRAAGAAPALGVLPRAASAAGRLGQQRRLNRFGTSGQGHGKRPRILITGCLGQVGTALVRLLRFSYGAQNVIASDVVIPSREFYRDGPFVYIDVTQYNTLAKIAVDEGIDWIVHNSSVQSVTGENDPQRAMDVHITGIRNVLEVARSQELRVLAPSSHAVFSAESGQQNTPDLTVMRPRTIYGVTKCFMENIGIYFYKKYGVDFRCLRYPGIISTLEEGASPARRMYRPTTDDYPVTTFHSLREGATDNLVVGLKEDTRLPFLYIDDCLTATETLLEAPDEQLTQRVYNVQGCSFSPRMMEEEIRKYLPDFSYRYQLDYRDKIASSWPNSLDDANFRRDLQWEPQWDLQDIVPTMLRRMGIIHATPHAAAALGGARRQGIGVSRATGAHSA